MTADLQQNHALNALLQSLGRSLLQYVGECWPWSADDRASDADKVKELVTRQQDDVGQLAHLLKSRGWTIDFGMYPVEYTDLHYVSLDFLLGQLAANARSISENAERVATECVDDHEAGVLLERIVTHSQDTANQLEQICRVRARVQPA